MTSADALPPGGESADETALRERLSRYAFYHVIRLTENVSTPGDPRHVESQAPVLQALRQLDLRGKRVLDVGCRDGLYSFEAERLGAAEVVGIDNDLSRGAIEVLIPYFRSSVRMHQVNLYDTTPSRFGTFDVIVFAGVLYHLRYPFWGLRVLRDLSRPGGLMVLETAIFHGLRHLSMLFCPDDRSNPYGPTSPTFFNTTSLLSTLSSFGWRVLSASCLHPAAEAAHADGIEPVIDRAVVVARFTGELGDESVYRYFQDTHDRHSGGRQMGSGPRTEPHISAPEGPP